MPTRSFTGMKSTKRRFLESKLCPLWLNCFCFASTCIAMTSRDLKPDNLGFNASNETKLFDFGLAKRLEPSIQTDNDLYLLTGNTGR
jgi:serine/threonine protein kinase